MVFNHSVPNSHRTQRHKAMRHWNFLPLSSRSLISVHTASVDTLKKIITFLNVSTISLFWVTIAPHRKPDKAKSCQQLQQMNQNSMSTQDLNLAKAPQNMQPIWIRRATTQMCIPYPYTRKIDPRLLLNAEGADVFQTFTKHSHHVDFINNAVKAVSM